MAGALVAPPRRLVTDRADASAVVYGVLAALISVAIIGAVVVFGSQLNGLFQGS